MEENKEISQKVNDYITKKEEMKVLDADAKKLNKELMGFLTEGHLDSYSGDKGTVSIQIKHSSEWDEDGLIKYLEDNNLGCIETEVVKTVNPDKLVELLAEHPELKDTISSFQHEKESKALVYKTSENKAKEKASTLFIRRGN